MSFVSSTIQLPTDIAELKTAAANFVDRKILPYEAEIYQSGEVPQQITNELRDLGYFGLTIDPEYGGSGLSHLAFCAVHEELSRAPKPVWNQINVANGVAARMLGLFASEEQKREFLPGVAEGRLQPAIAVTEPAAGSDVQGLKARADRVALGWKINGTKHYITFGARADLLFVLARTGDEGSGSRTFSLFLVRKGNPGLKTGRMQETMGGRPLEQAELVFDDCIVAEADLIGCEGEGLRCVLATFAEERITMAVTGLGTAQRAIELAVDYAKTRRAFGAEIASYQVIQHSLADCVTELFAARALVFEMARQLDTRMVTPAEAAMAKLFAAEMAHRVVDRCLQIFGGAGFMAETPICQMYRDVRVMRISGGTSEIQRNIIAKELLR